MRNHLNRLSRYGVVGIATNVAGYLVYLLVTWLGIGPKSAMTGMYALGVVLGYLGQRRFTFSYEGGHAAGFSRFVAAHICGYWLNFTLLYVFVDLMGFAHQIVQAVAIVIVAGFLFIAFSLFVFPSGGRQVRR